nr:sulfite exporter TauE/SafE family protein [Terrimonas ginsenosidimutans]
MLPAIVLGLASSLHCVGMCGPLSLAMPAGNLTGGKRYLNLLMYQLGRVSTYVMIGVIAGLLGRGILLAGYQQALSVVMGLIILIAAIGYYAGRKAKRVSFLRGFYLYINQLIARLIRKAADPRGAFMFGMANGLLPCGMVYLAAAGSLSFGSVYYAALFMLFFGLGTLPAMLLLGFAGRRLAIGRYRWLSRVSPFVMVLMGVLLLIRGLNWGIPYLSPSLIGSPEEVISCH